MQMNKISLSYYLAEEVLKEVYASKNQKNKYYEELKEVGIDYMTTKSVLKMYGRAFKFELNKKAVLIVVESLSENEKKLLRLKYGEEKQLVAISMMLNVSVTQLMAWNQNIIKKITEFLMYKLTTEDVYSEGKIKGMVELLKRSIEFFSAMSAINGKVRTEWLREMKRKKENYQKILNEIQKIKESKENDSFTKVVQTKLENPSQSRERIAAKCNVDQSVVSRYLKRFANSMRENLE